MSIVSYVASLDWVDLHSDGVFNPVALVIWALAILCTVRLNHALGPSDGDDVSQTIAGAFLLTVLLTIGMIGLAVVKWAWVTLTQFRGPQAGSRTPHTTLKRSLTLLAKHCA